MHAGSGSAVSHNGGERACVCMEPRVPNPPLEYPAGIDQGAASVACS